ncbi:vitellogenin-1-like [Sitodiplosis mosellana]|uniref:vitellogenin-1-like n=1 Tax=Sitodiplosis mosellana TaxID=263140 RepID=UPI00244412C1|nr:vitellogenin-1-like [Sitodiplosis mosellana]
MKYFLLVLLVCKLYAPTESLSLTNIGKSVVDITKGVAGKIPDVIPSAEDVFQSTKNLIAGYPFEKIYGLINSFCSAALSTSSVKPRTTPNIANMSYVLKVGDQNISVPLNQPTKLWLRKEFNPNLPLVMVITGWTTNANDTENPALDTVDTAEFVDTLYTWSAFNTEEIGNIISDSLQHLIRTYPIEKIHLVGHSLGAHIAGSAGRNLYKKTGKLVPRITGLDPANPCFNSGETLTGLARGDAEFVLAIHSNSGGLGKRDPLGDADFYPNGDNPLPPGCYSMSCAHQRAPEFFAESVYPGNENNFLGVKCDSLSSLNSKFCRTQSYPMGYATPHNLKGIFFLKTNEDKPYGLNATKNAKPVCNGPALGHGTTQGNLNSHNSQNSPNNYNSQYSQNSGNSPSNHRSPNHQNSAQHSQSPENTSNIRGIPSRLINQVKRFLDGPLEEGKNRE